MGAWLGLEPVGSCPRKVFRFTSQRCRCQAAAALRLSRPRRVAKRPGPSGRCDVRPVRILNPWPLVSKAGASLPKIFRLRLALRHLSEPIFVTGLDHGRRDGPSPGMCQRREVLDLVTIPQKAIALGGIVPPSLSSIAIHQPLSWLLCAGGCSSGHRRNRPPGQSPSRSG